MFYVFSPTPPYVVSLYYVAVYKIDQRFTFMSYIAKHRWAAACRCHFTPIVHIKLIWKTVCPGVNGKFIVTEWTQWTHDTTHQSAIILYSLEHTDSDCIGSKIIYINSHIYICDVLVWVEKALLKANDHYIC